MDKILPSYSDPLFSILIITILILIVAIVSYFLGNYKEERERENLKKFLGTISVDKSILDIDKLPFETSLISPLSMVAKNFSTKGEYQKAISIYLYLINNIQPFFQKEYRIVLAILKKSMPLWHISVFLILGVIYSMGFIYFYSIPLV